MKEKLVISQDEIDILRKQRDDNLKYSIGLSRRERLQTLDESKYKYTRIGYAVKKALIIYEDDFFYDPELRDDLAPVRQYERFLEKNQGIDEDYLRGISYDGELALIFRMSASAIIGSSTTFVATALFIHHYFPNLPQEAQIGIDAIGGAVGLTAFNIIQNMLGAVHAGFSKIPAQIENNKMDKILVAAVLNAPKEFQKLVLRALETNESTPKIKMPQISEPAESRIYKSLNESEPVYLRPSL